MQWFVAHLFWKHFSCEACPGTIVQGIAQGGRVGTFSFSPTYRFQNPDIPWVGRGGAAHGGAAERSGGRARRDTDGSVRPGDNLPSCPLEHRK